MKDEINYDKDDLEWNFFK